MNSVCLKEKNDLWYFWRIDVVMKAVIQILLATNKWVLFPLAFCPSAAFPVLSSLHYPIMRRRSLPQTKNLSRDSWCCIPFVHFFNGICFRSLAPADPAAIALIFFTFSLLPLTIHLLWWLHHVIVILNFGKGNLGKRSICGEGNFIDLGDGVLL